MQGLELELSEFDVVAELIEVTTRWDGRDETTRETKIYIQCLVTCSNWDSLFN